MGTNSSRLDMMSTSAPQKASGRLSPAIMIFTCSFQESEGISSHSMSTLVAALVSCTHCLSAKPFWELGSLLTATR